MSSTLTGSRLVRVQHESGYVCVGVTAGEELRLLEGADMLTTLEQERLPKVAETIPLHDRDTCDPGDPWTLLAPIKPPETWAAGVTYERSRSARMHESRGLDVYERVYDAERPELFLKDSAARRTVGPGDRSRSVATAPGRCPSPRSRSSSEAAAIRSA
jgi:2-dehydro-3-deoxy-D-arabinonate dehydratase